MQALSFSYFDVHSWRAGEPDDDDVDSPSFARRDAKHNTKWSAVGFPALVLTVNPAVSVLLFTVTFNANLAHSLTRPP